jgi:hypothetical protein
VHRGRMLVWEKKGASSSYPFECVSKGRKTFWSRDLPSYLNVPCYLNNRQRYCSVWPERDWTLYSLSWSGHNDNANHSKQADS